MLISVFCQNRDNLDLFIEQLKQIIVDLSLNINKVIEQNLSEIEKNQNKMVLEDNQDQDILLISKIES